ncbi:MAG TPA: hypothetical protein VIL74_09800 [Pyrinomonadaceae bacterium]|jgi:hypothetical protein
MNVTDYKEIWQIDAGGQVYEARFEEIAQWIYEGSLLPQDMVRRGNLRWIEARKVPALLRFFNAREQGMPPPVFASVTDGREAALPNHQAAQNFDEPPAFSANPFQSSLENTSADSFAAGSPNSQLQNSRGENRFSRTAAPNEIPPPFGENAGHGFQTMPEADFCTMHPDATTVFWCGTCGSGFCKTCPKSYGGTVKICPLCGAMCKSIKEVQAKTSAAAQFERDVTKGFGAADFFNALAYPFKYKTSLLVGALMFAFFMLGQGAASMGSVFLVGAAFVCWMLANMLTFGVMANTIENFAQGKIGGNFMPSFEDFSLWDDVVHPFFLSVGVYLVSFGLLFVIIIGTVFWGLNQVSHEISGLNQPKNARDATDPKSPFEDNSDFERQNDLYGDGEMPDADEIGGLQSRPGDTEEEVRRANELINDYRKKQAESIVGKSPETEAAESRRFYGNLASSPFSILALLLIGFGWGIFYMPAACMVAGYTRSFVATLNPAIGIETIKLLGFDYLKIWLMGFALLAAYFIFGLILNLIFSPFDLPTFGNIPAKSVAAVFFFYVSVVYSVALGFLLYKNADKMNLFKG